jgi:hypothetical protein
MSRGGRRGAPPDLKGTLGTLIRTTINQVGAMTDVARRQARTQKQRLDTALLDRRRREALADLGETLYELATAGEIELDELPELARAVQEVEEIDRRIAEAAQEASAGEGRRPVRLRPTGSAGVKRERREPDRQRVWRPTLDPEPEAQPEPAPEPRPAGSRQRRPTAEPGPAGGREAGPARGRGGIVFVDDDSAPGDVDPGDSLRSYMNDDDVPRRR